MNTAHNLAPLTALVSFVIDLQQQATKTSRRMMIQSIAPTLDAYSPQHWHQRAGEYLAQRVDAEALTEPARGIAQARNAELTGLAEVCELHADLLTRYPHPTLEGLQELVDDVWNEGAPVRQEVAHGLAAA